MTSRFADKTVLVVGGGSGMGRATVHRLLSEGARVAVVDRDFAAARETANGHPLALALTADIADAGEVEAAVADVVQWGGRLDGAVNAAGIGRSATILEQTAEQFDRVLSVNLTGTYNCLRSEATAMAAGGGGGAIVNFSSTNGLQPAAALSAYCSSKSAVDMLTKVAAMELAPHHIRVTAVGPALTETPLVQRFLERDAVREAFVSNIPLGRPGKPDEVAALAAFLLSDDAAYLTGHTYYADGGSLTMRYPTAAERARS